MGLFLLLLYPNSLESERHEALSGKCLIHCDVRWRSLPSLTICITLCFHKFNLRDSVHTAYMQNVFHADTTDNNYWTAIATITIIIKINVLILSIAKSGRTQAGRHTLAPVRALRPLHA